MCERTSFGDPKKFVKQWHDLDSPIKQHDLMVCFVGAVSAFVSAEKFDKALALAMKHVEMYEGGRNATNRLDSE